eukprot:CAMPEP_0169206836 /NCGR_PEP_ID=MMETSP1016-20121227/13257_1 /TAXON_ID=342587 /ORGANISM="Karlodinium micrum, Strain CCMP2283" /LENGTH=54 /DNA_ID=CAMNT_0009284063 /DNA_START=591 /DNA_END=755 /DNA_ORIENTATION=-
MAELCEKGLQIKIARLWRKTCDAKSGAFGVLERACSRRGAWNHDTSPSAMHQRS